MTDSYEETPPPDRTWTDHLLFHAMTPEMQARVQRQVRLRRYPAGTAVVRQGDTATHLFVVKAGQARITRDVDGQEVVVETLGRGEFFGEMGLLTDYHSPASVIAVTALETYAVAREAFDALIEQNFSLASHVVQIHNARSLALERATSEARAAEGAVAVATGPFLSPEPAANVTPQLMTIFSPAGGTGKTMLACNLGVLLARRFPRSVALVDLSLLASQCALLLNIERKHSIAAYVASAGIGDLAGFDAADWRQELMGVHHSSLAVLSMAHTPLEAVTLTSDIVSAVLDSVAWAFPIVIVDTTSVYSDVNLAAIARATRLLLVSSFELTSLRGMIECTTALADPDRPLDSRATFILNSTRGRPALRAGEFEARVKLPVASQLPYGADLPSVAERNGTALVDLKAQAPLSRELIALADRLAGTPAPVSAARR